MPVEWKQFLQEVMPDVPGCPVRVAENAIRNSAIEFCDETRIWRERAADIAMTVAGGITYPIDISAINSGEATMIAPHRVRLADSEKPLSVLAKPYLDDQWLVDGPRRPQWFYSNTPGEITFGPGETIDKDNTAFIWVVIKPSRAALTGPDFLGEQWFEEVAHGAKARLMEMPDKPWTQTNRVKYHRDKFVKGYVEARIRDAKSNVVGSTKAVPNVRFVRGSNSRYFR